jgi:hypothetical protein
MMPRGSPRPVVVAVDGSDAALVEAQFAPDEARLRCAPLHIVTALPTTTPTTSSSTPSVPSTSPSPDPTTPPPPTGAAPSTPGQARTTSPAGGVPASLRGEDVTAVPTSRRIVALTFDAGANSAGLASILATLADRDVTATFFPTGRWVDANRSEASSILAAGHRVGNHSTTHPHFPALSDEAIGAEVLGAEQRIRAVGADPRPLFRFPFEDRDARTIATVNDLGYVAVRWTSTPWAGRAPAAA